MDLHANNEMIERGKVKRARRSAAVFYSLRFQRERRRRRGENDRNNRCSFLSKRGSVWWYSMKGEGRGAERSRGKRMKCALLAIYGWMSLEKYVNRRHSDRFLIDGKFHLSLSSFSAFRFGAEQKPMWWYFHPTKILEVKSFEASVSLVSALDVIISENEREDEALFERDRARRAMISSFEGFEFIRD